MRKRLSSYALLIWTSCSLWSCQKSDIDPPEIEPTAGSLPAQLIIKGDGQDIINEAYSIEYDPNGRFVNIYKDDTTNATPYDHLVVSYQFNERGYLVRVDQQIRENGQEKQETVSIIRRNNDQIDYIANLDVYAGALDTIFFEYETNTTDLVLNTRKIARFEWTQEAVQEELKTYRYDANHLLVSLTDRLYPKTYSYSYNQQRLVHFSWQEDPYRASYDFEYESGVSRENTDSLMLTFLGRDYYIQQLRKLYFLDVYLEDDLPFSLTNPARPSAVQIERHEFLFDETSTQFIEYQMDEKSRLSLILLKSEKENLSIELRYR